MKKCICELRNRCKISQEALITQASKTSSKIYDNWNNGIQSNSQIWHKKKWTSINKSSLKTLNWKGWEIKAIEKHTITTILTETNKINDKYFVNYYFQVWKEKITNLTKERGNRNYNLIFSYHHHQLKHPGENGGDGGESW